MITLFNLQKTTKKKKRLGMGEGSNRGKNAGRGHKGQVKRGKVRVGFEGGQKPLIKRTPKLRGFKSKAGRHTVQLTLSSLNSFDTDAVVNLETLLEKNLISKFAKKVRIVATGKLDKKVKIEESEFIYLTKGAKEAIK